MANSTATREVPNRPRQTEPPNEFEEVRGPAYTPSETNDDAETIDLTSVSSFGVLDKGYYSATVASADSSKRTQAGNKKIVFIFLVTYKTEKGNPASKKLYLHLPFEPDDQLPRLKRTAMALLPNYFLGAFSPSKFCKAVVDAPCQLKIETEPDNRSGEMTNRIVAVFPATEAQLRGDEEDPADAPSDGDDGLFDD